MSIDKTQLSLGFDAGNYANAYQEGDYSEAIAKLSMNRPAEYVTAFTLGFFSSYELSEMGSDVEAYQEAYFSEAGKACVEAGFIDAREDDGLVSDDIGDDSDSPWIGED